MITSKKQGSVCSEIGGSVCTEMQGSLWSGQVGSLSTEFPVTATNTLICAGTVITLSASGATTYTWHPTNSNSASITGAPGSSGTFTLIGSNSGCKDSANISLTVMPKPTITILSSPANDTVCAGSPVTLSGNGASTYTWNNGITNGTAFTPTATAFYTVIGTGANTCTNTTSVQVVVNICTAVNNYGNTTLLNVYPNPSSGVVNIGLSLTNASKINYQVVNIAGETVYSEQGGLVNGNITKALNLTTLNKGIYFIRVITDKEIIMKKVVLQ